MAHSTFTISVTDFEAWKVQVLKPDELVRRTVICLTLELGQDAQFTLLFYTTESIVEMIAALHAGAGLLTP